jgi:hypothetical protein
MSFHPPLVPTTNGIIHPETDVTEGISAPPVQSDVGLTTFQVVSWSRQVPLCLRASATDCFPPAAPTISVSRRFGLDLASHNKAKNTFDIGDLALTILTLVLKSLAREIKFKEASVFDIFVYICIIQ